MKIACHYTIPQPPNPELDAAVQDGFKIINYFGGEINFLYPGSKPIKLIPRFLSGFHQMNHIRRLERRVDVHQVFGNGIYPYPAFYLFRKPIVYTSIIGFQQRFNPISINILKRVERFVVTTDEDKKNLNKYGFDSDIIIPGIDIGKFSNTPSQSQKKFTLLYGSAPWNEEQFESKGVNALLRVAKNLPWLHLVFLWRGKHLQKMKERVLFYGLADRAQIIDKKVDVNRVLEDVHASIVLAEKSELVKSYPHSLLESLAAGKPVMISSCIPMSGYVEKNNCGLRVNSIVDSELENQICLLHEQYEFYVSNVNKVDLQIFSAEQMLLKYEQLYKKVLG